MKAYPKYKDSGVPWLEDVPEHWEVLRLGSQFVERKQKVSDKDFAPLSVTKKGILPQLDTAAKSNDGDNRKKVCSGDFVINSRSDRKGSSGVSPHTGSVSLINTVLTPISLDGRYVHNFFRSHSFQEEFYRVGRGIVADLWSTKYADMRTIMIPVPTEDEQHQISRYLDWQTSKINKFIKAKKRLITLLKEQKQNIINEAVTKGINPDVEMKDSGVEWLGKIPAHWTIRRLKYISNLNEETLTDSTDPDYLFHYVDIGSVSTGTISKNLNLLNYSNAPSRAKRVVSKGDTIISTVRTYLKSIYHFEHELKDIIASTGFAVFTPVRIFPKMLGYLLLFDGFIDQVIRLSVGASYPAINADRLCDIAVTFPEDQQEQKSIVKYIEKETALIDQTIARTEREIELIAEYRTRLVSDVVTGKVDVRSVEIPDFEPVEAEMEAQDDEESEDGLITEGIEE